MKLRRWGHGVIKYSHNASVPFYIAQGSRVRTSLLRLGKCNLHGELTGANNGRTILTENSVVHVELDAAAAAADVLP